MTGQRPLAADVAASCRRTSLLLPGERVLVAVSGGADSTALALLLGEASGHGLPLDLVLAHVDHGWRGEAAARADRDLVEALGRKLGVDVVVFPPPEVPVPTEDTARRWRYRCLDEAARERGCGKVATGHHLRDQAETVLMRLERGSGPVGLRGIPRRRPLGEHGVEVVRPLLDVDPRRMRAWLSERGVSWREDETNEDLSRDRVRARRRLLAIEARGGSASKHLAELADRLRSRLARQETHVADRLDGVLVRYPAARAVEVPRDLLASLSPGLLDLAFRQIGSVIGAQRDGPWFTRRHLACVRRLLADGGALDLPRGLCFVVSGRRTWLRRWTPPAPIVLPRLERRDVAAKAFDLPAFLERAAPGEAALDAGRLGETATVRLVSLDDDFTPWDRGPPRRVAVMKWLTRRQVPTWLRRVQVVVEGASGIAWVPGHRVDRDHGVRAKTRRVALLRVTWGDV